MLFGGKDENHVRVREEYESLKETAAVRSDKEILDEIRKGIARLKKNKARLYTLKEL